MTVLITGGAGYIGSHMMWALLDAGETPVVIDRLSSGFRWAIPMEVPFYEVDIADKAAVAKIIQEHKIDAIVHFAGSISVPESIENPLAYYKNNTVNSQGLIETALENGVEAFVFSSTAAVYGTPSTTKPVEEDIPLHPQSPYGHSKLMTERMLADTATAHDGFNYSALRYFNVAGADPKGRTGQSTKGAMNLIKVACETAAGKRDHIEVFGTDYDTPDGTCIRDFIHVTDLVNAHMSALNKMRGVGGSMVTNCGYGEGFSVLQVLKAVAQIAGTDIEIKNAPRRKGDIISITADNSRIRSLTEWQAKHDDLGEIIQSSYDWEQHLSKLNHH